MRQRLCVNIIYIYIYVSENGPRISQVLGLDRNLSLTKRTSLDSLILDKSWEWYSGIDN